LLAEFVAANSSCQSIQRGLAIITYQVVVDNPEFHFADSDFGDWIDPLFAVSSVGDRRRKVTQCGRPFRPPLVPVRQIPKIADDDGKHIPQMRRARHLHQSVLKSSFSSCLRADQKRTFPSSFSGNGWD
jgi:hypothetical protein